MIIVWILSIAIDCGAWGCTQVYDEAFKTKEECFEARDNLQKMHYQKDDVIFCKQHPVGSENEEANKVRR